MAPGHVVLEEVLELEGHGVLSTSGGGHSVETQCLSLSTPSRYELEEGLP